MPIDPGNIDVVCFDYGNTLIPFGPAQSRALAESLHADLERLFGPADAAQLEALCVEARLAPFIGASPSLREHRHEALLASIVETLYGAPGGAAQLDQLRIARYEHFCALIEVEQHVHETLGKLKARYRLGFLSNYPDAQAIRGSLQAHRLDSYFDHVVISGEVGYVKPHPVTFAQLLAPFGVPSRRVVYVGDNWLADVQGAKRVGMHAIQMRRWEGIEAWPENEGDHAPDAIIHHLGELEALLLP
jgi:HAD superfamily hydrolase (TIGR01549 family)